MLNWKFQRHNFLTILNKSVRHLYFWGHKKPFSIAGGLFYWRDSAIVGQLAISGLYIACTEQRP
jgi:hypothetical protein